MPARDSTGVVAVIDVGSDYEGACGISSATRPAHLRALAGSRASLRLVADVDRRGELSESTMGRVTEALRDFKALARGAGGPRASSRSRRPPCATPATVRCCSWNAFAGNLASRFEQIISGVEEARYGFAGAIRGLDVSSGLLFDVGGGSMQMTRFDRRRRGPAVSLPAWRPASERAIPRIGSRRRGRSSGDCANASGASWEALTWSGCREATTSSAPAERCAISRRSITRRSGPHRVPLHGYDLPLSRLRETVELLASLKEKRRDNLAGLSADRADSIIGGAVAIQTVAEFVGAAGIVVSNQGVREGLALQLLDVTRRFARDGEDSFTVITLGTVQWLAPRDSVAAGRRRVGSLPCDVSSPAVRR